MLHQESIAENPDGNCLTPRGLGFSIYPAQNSGAGVVEIVTSPMEMPAADGGKLSLPYSAFGFRGFRAWGKTLNPKPWYI